jgi:hypothetical protein
MVMVVLGGVFLAVLPETVCRVAIAQMLKLTHRDALLRIQRVPDERSLLDFRAAVAPAFKDEVPGVKPPESDEERDALLREREPLSDARLNELLGRRVAAVRDALTKTEGIAVERVIHGRPRPRRATKVGSSSRSSSECPDPSDQ